MKEATGFKLENGQDIYVGDIVSIGRFYNGEVVKKNDRFYVKRGNKIEGELRNFETLTGRKEACCGCVAIHEKI